MEEEIVLMEENDIEEISIEEENYSGKPYILPIASKNVLGGIKVGENLTIDEDGTLNAQAGGNSGIVEESDPTVPQHVKAIKQEDIDKWNNGTGNVDLTDYAKKGELPTKTSQLTNDSGYINAIPNEYITESELDAKGYLTTIPFNYKTKEENDNLYQAKGNYLTSYTETDPVFKSSPAFNITQENINKWNNLYIPDIPDEVQFGGSTAKEGADIWIKLARNLFNPKSINKTNTSLNSSALEMNDYYYWGVSDYIEIEPNTDYTLSGITYGTTSRYHCWYDSDKKLISTFPRFLQTVKSQTYKSPSNAKYIRFSLFIGAENNSAPDERTTFQLEKGTVATPYTPYSGDKNQYLVKDAIGTYNDFYDLFPVNINAITKETDPIFSASASANITNEDISNWNAKSDFSGSYNDLTNKPTIPTVPTNISSFTNDSGYLTSIPSEYITETELNEVISNIGGGTGNVSSDIINSIMVVDTLPETEVEGVLYLVKEVIEEDDGNLYDPLTAPVLNAYISTGSKVFSTSENEDKSTYLQIEPNTTYKITKLAGAKFSIGTCPEEPSSYTNLTVAQKNENGSEQTITSGATDNYLAIFYYTGGQDTLTEEELRNSITVTKVS